MPSHPRSDHFDGRRFHDPDRVEHGFRAFLQWMLTRDRARWPEWVDDPPAAPPPERVERGRMRVTFVNHATVLLQMDGLNLLTDPVWSERVSPLSWLGPRRHRHPGVRYEDLPPIDAVFVSHNHYDHMDTATLRRLSHDHRPRVITPLGNGRLLSRAGLERVTEADWWDSVDLGGEVRLTAVPARHWSNRAGVARNTMLWAGCVLEGPSGSALFAGDTGYGPHFREIRERLGAPRLALLPIGAYEPRWFMEPVHMHPEDAVRAHRELGASASVATHFGTFQLTDEGIDDPVRALEAALRGAGEEAPFRVLAHGEGWEVPPGDATGETPSGDAAVR